jgi:hypothetical protein
MIYRGRNIIVKVEEKLFLTRLEVFRVIDFAKLNNNDFFSHPRVSF